MLEQTWLLGFIWLLVISHRSSIPKNKLINSGLETHNTSDIRFWLKHLWLMQENVWHHLGPTWPHPLKTSEKSKGKNRCAIFSSVLPFFAKECVALNGSLKTWPEITSGILSISGNALSRRLIISTDTDTKWIGYWRDVTDPRFRLNTVLVPDERKSHTSEVKMQDIQICTSPKRMIVYTCLHFMCVLRPNQY